MKRTAQPPTRYWWAASPEERFWCEITDREDVGSDLKCPQSDESGDQQPGYNLIRAILPGDVVFHYSTRERAIVGASVAGGPLEERPIVWIPHGTVGKSKKHIRDPRPGWWLPIYQFTKAENRLTLRDVQNPIDDRWIRDWIEAKGRTVKGPIAAPFQRYREKLRAAQTYLAKMPVDFVNRWLQLQQLSDAVADAQEMLSPLADFYAAQHSNKEDELRFKSDVDYVAFIQGGPQRRTRGHERLVRAAAEHILSHGGKLSTPHPIDLLMEAPAEVIFEAKVTTSCSPILAVREAVGQLFEYKYFLGHKSSGLCVLLDRNPGPALARYLEQGLGIYIIWWTGKDLMSGERTGRDLGSLGIDATIT